MRARVAARTDVGRVRQGNEDSYLVREPLFVVADGMGGHLGGEVASETAVTTITEGAGQPPDPSTLGDLVRQANAAIWEKAQTDDALHGMGTTCTLMLLEPRQAHLAHVGDSRAYLFRDGNLSQLTEDHTLVERMVREGRLTAEEAEHHPQRSIITRALGVDSDVEVDTFTLDLAEGDRLLLCSDGLTSMIDGRAITDVLTRETDTQAAVDLLVDLANRAGGEDNITVLLIDLRGEEESLSTTTTTAPREDTEPAPAPAPPPAPPSDDAGSSRRGWGKAVLTVLLVALLLAGAAWAARAYTLGNSYFVGAGADGTVTIFRGIPDDIAGVSVRELEESTDVRLTDLPEFLQADVAEGIRSDSLDEARETVHNLEERAADREFEKNESGTNADGDRDGDGGQTDRNNG